MKNIEDVDWPIKALPIADTARDTHPAMTGAPATPMPQVPAFVPICSSALVICDLITADLLFSQFAYLRSRSFFILASGYFFTASKTASLMFLGLFATASQPIAIADKNLFRAKLSGRNRMISSPTNPTPFHIAAEAR